MSRTSVDERVERLAAEMAAMNARLLAAKNRQRQIHDATRRRRAASIGEAVLIELDKGARVQIEGASAWMASRCRDTRADRALWGLPEPEAQIGKDRASG